MNSDERIDRLEDAVFRLTAIIERDRSAWQLNVDPVIQANGEQIHRLFIAPVAAERYDLVEDEPVGTTS